MGASRTDSYVQIPAYGHRVFDGEALARPCVKDAGFWEEVVGQLLDPFPAPPKRAPPEAGNMERDGRSCREVCRHCVVAKKAGDGLRSHVPCIGTG